MHPALSIIVFTTVSGLGYGLAAALGAGFLDPAHVSTKLAHLLALALIGGGLMSSTLHLRNPQRAWRAFSQWRSSWLSREGVMAVATFAPLCISAAAAIFQSRYLPVIGMLGVVGSVITVYCTSMIYASLKAVQTWHTPLTPACYLLFSAAGGSLLGAFFRLVSGTSAPLLLVLAALFLALAWGVKWLWRKNSREAVPLSTAESATGLGTIGQVRLFESPHVNDNYLTSEMGFRVARKHADKLFVIAVLAGGALPVALALIVLATGATGALAAIALGIAVLSHGLGMLVERWLFFAEARHAVMNYYGR
ncbi:DmsC/YnfH family molybdoenzyme membrane anchor subunit [Mesorhizobium sp. CAU 1741]|uniref:dimethyl sulfoxide reductase anchor subunit family protein n=1 Tax=Mesorhizobium sp. CAU 1741 TaxID=3140366 RepID=UPI00325A5F63